MGNLDRVVQHMNSLEDKCKADRVAAFVRALERRKQRIQKTAEKWQKQQALPLSDQPPPS